MLNLGTGEIILIAIIALIFIPPKKLPQVATTLGRLMAQVQKGFREIKDDLKGSFKNDVLEKKPSKEEKSNVQSTTNIS